MASKDSQPNKKRAIDDIPFEEPRPQQMQVLALGLSRTGTMSLQRALDRLGYKAYHYLEVSQPNLPNETHAFTWNEAYKAKMYGSSKAYGREEFDRLLRNYSAVTDAPCCCFPDELVGAYPEAKVILNIRDKQKWLASMETSYYAILEQEPFRFFRAISELDFDGLHPVIEGLRMPLMIWTGGDWQNREKLAEGFDKHYAHVRDIVPSNNMLEWQPKDGWGPLCKFLGKEVPNEPFPHINRGTEVQNIFVMVGGIRLATLFFDAIKWPVLTIGTAALAWWQYSKRVNI